jgi:hypothetical protein
MSDHSTPPNSSARLSRRQLIQVGGAGLFGLSLPRLLWADGLDPLHIPSGGSAKSCIFIVLSGGFSHIDTLDPKPAAPAEIRGPYQAISTSVPGMQISDRLPLLATLADRFTLVRSLSHPDTVHVSAAHTMLTGQPEGSSRNQSPMIGSLISKFRPATASMPSHVWLHNMKTGTNKVPRYDSGLNSVGYAHAAMRVGYELDNPSDPEFRVKAFDPPQGLSSEQLADRIRLLDEIDPRANPLSESPAGGQFDVFRQKARDLVAGLAARHAFDLNSEPDSSRDRYGRHPLGQYLLMSRRLIEAGVRLVTVTAWPGLAPGETTPTITQVWDMHDDRYKGGDSMYGNGPFGMQWSLPRLDQGVSALLADLDERGMLDETLVVMVSEFGRTPKFEGKGNGRGHWPHCYAALLAGGGIRGGAVYGSSDKQGAYVASGRPISHADFGATLFHALGIPPETRYGPDGASLRVSPGTPVLDLFA